MKSVLIVQAYVPQYRQPFFDLVVQRLAALDVECRVLLTDEMEPDQASRKDEAPDSWWTVRTHGRAVPARGHLLRTANQRRHWGKTDVVVFPLAGSWLDVYRALLTRNGPKVALWGHVAPYTQTGVGIDLRLERWQMKRADHVFAYTDHGRDYAIERGVRPSRVTALGNTVDVAALREASALVSDEDVGRFRDRHGLAGVEVFAVIGGLDGPKRVEFLAHALDELWQVSPTARVLVAGGGRDAGLLDQAEQRGQVVRLGPVGDRTKALMGRTADALLNPGRIGLIAIDALVLRLPLITTAAARHGPEFDYLVEGESVRVTANNPDVFVAVARSVRGARPPQPHALPTLDSMADRFVSVISSLVD